MYSVYILFVCTAELLMDKKHIYSDYNHIITPMVLIKPGVWLGLDIQCYRLKYNN